MRTFLMVALGVAPGCVVVGDCPHCGEPAECVDVSMSNPDGTPDGCDLAACVTCADACGEPCSVLESYPPVYACEGGDSFDVYDFCPDWHPPETTPDPSATDIVDLGCGLDGGGESLVAIATGPGAVAVTHLDYAEGCCPTAVEVDVTAAGNTLVVGYTLVEDLCDCVCALDVSYDVVGLTAGNWTLVAGAQALQTTVTVP